MSGSPGPWKKVVSTSRPGRCYYFNTTTKESRWSEPPDFELEVKHKVISLVPKDPGVHAWLH